MKFSPTVLGEEDLRWDSSGLRKFVKELMSGLISEASTERKMAELNAILYRSSFPSIFGYTYAPMVLVFAQCH